MTVPLNTCCLIASYFLWSVASCWRPPSSRYSCSGFSSWSSPSSPLSPRSFRAERYTRSGAIWWRVGGGGANPGAELQTETECKRGYGILVWDSSVCTKTITDWYSQMFTAGFPQFFFYPQIKIKGLQIKMSLILI